MGTVLCMPNLYTMANHSHDQLFVQALNVSFTIKASHLKNEYPNVQTVGENTGGPNAATKSGVAFALKQIMNQDQRSVSTIHVFGIHHRSAEHAFQYVIAICCGDLSKATAIQAAETALDAKMISKTIQINDEFIDKQEKLMEEIVNAKYDQVEAFREILDKQEQSTLFAESVYDDFWRTSLNKAGIEHTDHRKWPGQNVLGQIFRKIVSTRRPAPPRISESVPRNLQAAS